MPTVTAVARPARTLRRGPRDGRNPVDGRGRRSTLTLRPAGPRAPATPRIVSRRVTHIRRFPWASFHLVPEFRGASFSPAQTPHCHYPSAVTPEIPPFHYARRGGMRALPTTHTRTRLTRYRLPLFSFTLSLRYFYDDEHHNIIILIVLSIYHNIYYFCAILLYHSSRCIIVVNYVHTFQKLYYWILNDLQQSQLFISTIYYNFIIIYLFPRPRCSKTRAQCI